MAGKISSSAMLPGNFYIRFGLELFNSKFQIWFEITDENRNGKEVNASGETDGDGRTVIDDIYDMGSVVSDAIVAYAKDAGVEDNVDADAIRNALFGELHKTFGWLTS